MNPNAVNPRPLSFTSFTHNSRAFNLQYFQPRLPVRKSLRRGGMTGRRMRLSPAWCRATYNRPRERSPV